MKGTRHDLRHTAGDIACADQTQHLIVDLMAHKFRCAELMEAPLPHADVNHFQLAVECHEQRHRQLRHRLCAQVGHIGYGDAQLRRHFHINKVAADPVHGDDLHILGLTQQVPCHGNAAGNDGHKALGMVKIVHHGEMSF